VGCNQNNPSDSTYSQSTNSSMNGAGGLPDVSTNAPATNSLPNMDTNTPAGTNQ
jgi:hypothetical protein